MTTMHTRRVFLRRGLTVLSAAVTMPQFLQRTVLALNNPNDLPLTQAAMGVGEQILVVLQLSGGNDGLSTVIPLDNDDYRRARPQLSVMDGLLPLGHGVALHPGLTGLKELYDAGQLAVLQGVGYPNPNRSHFRAMEIWHTADPKNPPQSGWLGRYFDARCSGSDPKSDPEPIDAISIGANNPLALEGEKFRAISFQRPEAYQWFASRNGDPRLKSTYAQIGDLHAREGAGAPASNSTLDFLERTALDAQLTSDEILGILAKSHSSVSYPTTPLGQQLQIVAQMIAAGLKTRVYYVSFGGFDTHTQEKGTHDRLMQNLSTAIAAFMKDLKAQGNDQRTVLMTFSEFGRRVAENASHGTDHGTAAPMFVFGHAVKGGVYGAHPSLRAEDLDHGDLKFHTDFRSVYASILHGWLHADANKVLGGSFGTVPMFG